MLGPYKVRTKLYIHSYEHFIHTATAALPKGAPKYNPPYIKKERKKKKQKQKLCRSQWSIQQNVGFILSIRLCCSSQCCLLCTGNNNNDGHLPPVHNTLPPCSPPPQPLLPGYTTDGWLLFRVWNAGGGSSGHVVSSQVSTAVTLSHPQSPCLQQGNACLMILTDFHTI